MFHVKQRTREHAVACWMCGYDPRTQRARTLTWNDSGLCDKHEEATDA
jgi:hypothetical protein